jgi:hypothetical protein
MAQHSDDGTRREDQVTFARFLPEVKDSSLRSPHFGDGRQRRSVGCTVTVETRFKVQTSSLSADNQNPILACIVTRVGR